MLIADARWRKLLDEVYKAGGDGDWETVFDWVSCDLRSTTSGITIRSYRAPTEIMDGYFTNFDPSRWSNFTDYFAEREPVLDVVIQQEFGRPFTLEELGLAEAYRDTEFFNDFMRPGGEERSSYASLPLDGDYFLGFASHRTDREGGFDSDELAYIEQLVPHIARAARIARHRREWGAHDLAKQLGRLGTALFMLDEVGRVCEHNERAGRLLESNKLVGLRRGSLRFHERHDQLAYINAIGASENGPAWFVAGAGRFHGTVERPRSSAWQISHIVFLTELGRCPTGAKLWLQDAFDLTSAEADVAVALAELGSIRAVAIERDVSEGTVRHQLKVVMSKARVRKQSELIALIITAPDTGA